MNPDDVPRRRPQAAVASEDVMPDPVDSRTQAVVLGLLLEIYPAPLSLAELVLELAEDLEDFTQRDNVERAARDLVRSGLLHQQPGVGQTVVFFPTRAAARFAALPTLLP
jgi:hypothetical protein